MSAKIYAINGKLENPRVLFSLMMQDDNLIGFAGVVKLKDENGVETIRYVSINVTIAELALASGMLMATALEGQE